MKREQLFYAIGMIEDTLVKEADPANQIVYPQKNNGWIRSAKPVLMGAAAALILFFVLINHFDPRFFGVPNDKELQNQSAGLKNVKERDKEEESNSPKTAAKNLFINELVELPQSSGDIDLCWDDYITMTEAQLQEYYKANIYPTQLPDKIERKMVKDVTYGNLGIFKRADGTVYYDTNELKYQSKDSNQSILVSVALGKLPVYDVFEAHKGKLKESSINGNRVLLAHYKNESGEQYYAEFLYENVGFNLWGTNVTQDEFAKVVEGYLGK